jgi:type II secretory pathway pseudopilin PulG
MNKSKDPKVKDLLASLADVPERDPRAAMKGRERFLAQARKLAPAVSIPAEVRHTGWNKNIFERIWKNMKPRSVGTALVAVVVLAVVAVFVVNNVTTVSAQQVLQRASAAQSAAKAAVGIQHYRIAHFQNPQAIEPGGTQTVNDTYFDPATGYTREIIRDSAGKIISADSADGSYEYSSRLAGVGASGLTIERQAQVIDSRKLRPTGDSTAAASAAFDAFSANPRVEMVGKQTWTDGSQVYVLVDRNVQTQKAQDGTNNTTLTGSVQMVFNAQTYQLVESETSVHKDSKDVIIESYAFLVNEVLPADSVVAWNLSDLTGVTFVDAPKTAQAAPVEPGFAAISAQELALHSKSYQLKSLPAGFSMEIVAPTTQQAGQDHYQFEIHYTGPDNATFNMMAVGLMDPSFVASSFYDGSYKTAAGLVLNYSPSSNPKNGVSGGMLVTPDGSSYLVDSTLTRTQIQALVEDLVQVP